MPTDMFSDTSRFAWSFVASGLTLMVCALGLRHVWSPEISLFANLHAAVHICMIPVAMIGMPLVGWLQARNIFNVWTLMTSSAIVGCGIMFLLLLLAVPGAEGRMSVTLLMSAAAGLAGAGSAFMGWLVWHLWPLRQSDCPGRKAPEPFVAEPKSKKVPPSPTIQKR